MKFMKKETEEVIEEICKNKKSMGYVLKNLILLMFSSTAVFAYELDFSRDVTNWEDILIRIFLIIYSSWCIIESFVGICKIGNVINKTEKEKEENDGK